MRFKNSKSVLMSFPNGKQKSPISFESVFNFGSDRKFVTKHVFRLILTFLLRKVSSTELRVAAAAICLGRLTFDNLCIRLVTKATKLIHCNSMVARKMHPISLHFNYLSLKYQGLFDFLPSSTTQCTLKSAKN